MISFAMIKVALLLTMSFSLFSMEEPLVTDFVLEPVLFVFRLTVHNKDKNTKEISDMALIFTLKEWQANYGKLTQQEVNSFKQFGLIKANPVTIIKETL